MSKFLGAIKFILLNDNNTDKGSNGSGTDQWK